MKNLLILIIVGGGIFVQPLLARNMAYTHGHNYTYSDPSNNDVTFFPVAWDLRGTFYLLRDYYRLYQGLTQAQAETMAESRLESILTEAEQAGVNTLIIRTELFQLNQGYTTRRANQARNLGLNVILGGMKCGGGTIGEGLHNADVFSIWQDYWDAFGEVQMQGDFCGVYAHDEPDNHNYEYYDEVASIALLLHSSGGIPGSNGLDLPLGAALARVGDYMLAPATIRNGTTFSTDSTNWKSTPFVFGHSLDYISMNYYPARLSGEVQELSFPELGLTDDDIVVFRGAADLVPSQGVFRNAFCDRDEYYAITGSGALWVYRLEGADELGQSYFQIHDQYDLQLDFLNNDYLLASSDTRSSDIGSRPGDPVLNGGLVLWLLNEPISTAKAVYWHNGDIRIKAFPAVAGYDSKVFCVGELDYRSGWNTSTTCSGVIGSDEMRILWVGSPQQTQPVDSPWRVKVFRRDSSGDLFACTTDQGSNNIALPEGFHPIGAIWGYFWQNSGDSPHFRSGFILYTADGHYMVIRTPAMSPNESWGATDNSTVYSNLWGQNMVAGPVTVFRDNWNYPFTWLGRTHDRFIALVSPAGSSPSTYIVWSSVCNGPGQVTSDPTVNRRSVIGTHYPIPRAEYLSSLMVYDQSQELKIKLFFNDNTPNADLGMRQSGFVQFPFPEGPNLAFSDSMTNSWEALSEFRTRHSRLWGPDVMVAKTATSLYLWAGQTPTTFPDIYFENMFSSAASSFQDMGALDIMLEYGVNLPPAECLFLTVQCHGRGSFGSGQFFPGHGVMGYDELMYMMGASLVHGIRGFKLYGLDMALFGGPTNPSVMNRFPPELLFWGASIDGPDDVDMVTLTHQAVHGFTHIVEADNDVINLLEVLVDPNFEIMGEDDAFNCNVAPPFPVYEPYINFIALKEPDGDILVLISNDGDGNYQADRICFPDTSYPHYTGEPEFLIGGEGIIGGWSKYPTNGYYLNVSALDSQHFSLIRIPAPGNDHRGLNTSTVIEETRSLSVSRNTGSSVLVEAQGAEARVFDLSGRVVERIACGEAVEFTSRAHPAGVYFAVLSVGNTPLFIEKLVLLGGGR